MKKYLLFLFLISTFSVYAQNIVINEVMASNKTTIFDEDGNASDWLELYNRGNEQINLDGYTLSDDTSKINKWRFGNKILLPGEYLIVFASSKNRVSTYFHTNFNISASGESMILADSKGIIIDRVDVPASQSDISYGRENDGSAKWIFQNPSPGKSNTGNTTSKFADSILTSITGGFYSSSINVSLSAGSSIIYYTLDGKDPDSTSSKYSSPISITKTTVLKTISLKKDYLPSPILCQTYFISESTDLPVISLSSDPKNLFDKSYGIYTNYTMDWERPAHVEFFDDEKKPGFSKDCYISIHGSQSAEWAQKSLNVKFNNGIENLKYPLFPGFYVNTFQSFILRNSGNDWQYTHIRDAMMQMLVKDLNIDYQEYRPATSFINGEYWGIYNIRERINEDYLAYRYGVNPDNIDLLENNMNVIAGDSLNYLQLINYITKTNMNTDSAYNYINKMIDMDECILYFAAQAYYDNMDWPGTNIKFWRERSATGKWRWILFDLDFGFGLYAHGPSEDHIKFMFSPIETRYSNPPWATLLQRKLIENSIIKNKFINQIADLLNTNLKSDRVVNLINTLANHISNEIAKHRKRWNLTGESTTKLITFANERPAYLRTHVRNYFSCGNDGVINVNSTAGGKVKLNSLTLQKTDFPWKGTYFDNNPIYLRAIAEPGYKFDDWSGDITSSSDSLSFNVVRSMNISANFSIDNRDTKGIVINEINYNSSSQFDPGDWVEIYNRSNTNIDISKWSLSDSDPNHAFIFPAGTVLEANKYLVIIENVKSFTTCFPNVNNYAGPMDFGLSGSGELVRIFDENKYIIDSLTYSDRSPWPTAADGQGATLELTDPYIDNSLGINWKASLGHGTPGKVNSVKTSISENNNVEKNFTLSQNYPNPFNPVTTIKYSVPTFQFVNLKVFDILGKEIISLVNEEKQPGNYEIKFDGSNYPSGIYYYRTQSGNYIHFKKMILLK